jgi:hypothetical protein
MPQHRVNANAHHLLRLLFFATESGTLVGWIIFSAYADSISYRGHVIDSLKPLQMLVLVSLLTLPVVSFCLRRTDRLLAIIGFATFVGTWIVTAIFQAL